MECPTCHASVDAGAAFCATCGSRLPSPAAQPPGGSPWSAPPSAVPAGTPPGYNPPPGGYAPGGQPAWPPPPGAAGSPYAPPGQAPNAPPGYAPPGYAPPAFAPPGYAPPSIYSPPGYRGAGPTVLRPTAWTEPLQIATAAYLVVAALTGIFVAVTNLAAIQDQATQSLTTSPNLTPDQVQGIQGVVGFFVIALPVVLGMLMIALGILAYVRRATWVFVVAMVLASMGALGGLLGLIPLAVDPGGPSNVGNRLAINGFVGLLAAGLVIFMAISLSRYGIWACRRVPAEAAPASGLQ